MCLLRVFGAIEKHLLLWVSDALLVAGFKSRCFCVCCWCDACMHAEEGEEIDTTLKDFYEAEMPEQDAEDAEDFEPPCDAEEDDDIEEEDEEGP